MSSSGVARLTNFGNGGKVAVGGEQSGGYRGSRNGS